MVNYDKDVYFSKVDYEKKMRETKEVFIKSKYIGIDNHTFGNEVDRIWLNIDHSYMERRLETIGSRIRQEDHITLAEQKAIPNRYELNGIDKFKKWETTYATRMKEYYSRSDENNVDFLTQTIKDFPKHERIIPYYPKGNKSEQPISMHTPSEYLSMLYNTNLRIASWNNTIKDGQILGIDLVYLEPHPYACEDCASHMGKIYSISGKSLMYPSIEQAYNNGVGHPNCKCNFTLVWESQQAPGIEIEIIEPKKKKSNLVDIALIIATYEAVQKARALQRDIDNYKTDYELYRYIGNYGESDKTIGKIEKLTDELAELLVFGNVAEYMSETSQNYELATSKI